MITFTIMTTHPDIIRSLAEAGVLHITDSNQQLSPEVMTEASHIYGGDPRNKIKVIKYVKGQTGWDLKRCVDWYRDTLDPTHNKPY